MNSIHLKGWFSGLAIYSNHLEDWLGPTPRGWCNWSGVGQLGRHPSFSKTPQGIHMCSPGWEPSVWSEVLVSAVLKAPQVILIGSQGWELPPTHPAASLWVLKMGRHYFLKIILSTSRGVFTHALQCTPLGDILQETVGPAVTWFLICNWFSANMFFDFCLSRSSWGMIYETDR